MPTPNAGADWLWKHPTRQNVPGAKPRPVYGWSWAELCVAAVFWAIGARNSAGTANFARKQSSMQSRSRPATLVDGMILWFDLGTDGHVCFADQGKLWMASTHCSHLVPGGQDVGYCISIAEYEARSGARFYGWGWDFIGQEFDRTSTAGTGTVTPILEGADDMDTEWAIERFNDAGVTRGLFMFDYAEKTWRACGHSETFILRNEKAAGRAEIYPVNDTTWTGADFVGWTQYVPPTAVTGTGLSKADAQVISDSSDAKVLTAISAIPKPPTKATTTSTTTLS